MVNHFMPGRFRCNKSVAIITGSLSIWWDFPFGRRHPESIVFKDSLNDGIFYFRSRCPFIFILQAFLRKQVRASITFSMGFPTGRIDGQISKANLASFSHSAGSILLSASKGKNEYSDRMISTGSLCNRFPTTRA